MEKYFKNPSNVHVPFSSYTHCVEVIDPNKFLFFSGQVPAKKDGSLLNPDDFEAQGKLAMKNLESVLSNSGGKLSDIVKLVTYLTRQNDVPAARNLLKSYFPDNPPANSVCIVQSLTHQDILIEIEATAAL